MDQTPLERFKELHRSFLYIDYKISDLAKYLDVSRRTIERWLRGKYAPNEVQQREIEEFLSKR